LIPALAPIAPTTAVVEMSVPTVERLVEQARLATRRSNI